MQKYQDNNRTQNNSDFQFHVTHNPPKFITNKMLDMSETNMPVFHSVFTENNQTEYLSTLWQKIEKYELRNKKAELKVDQLFNDVQDTLAPHHQAFSQKLCAYIEHLLNFLDDPKLKSRTREHLLAFLDFQLQFIQRLPLITNHAHIKALEERFLIHFDKKYKHQMKREADDLCAEIEYMIKSMFGDDVEIPKDRLRDAILSRDENQVEAIIRSMQESYMTSNPYEENVFSDEDHEWEDFEFNYFHGDEEDSFNVKEMFRGTQLNKMYKRIANVIHPDKETDPLKKEEKHVLMQKLAVAKKNNDVMTLVRMFTQYVPDAECILDEDTLLRMEHLLDMRIRELNLEHRAIFNDQGDKSNIWKKFSATSKKKVNEKLNDYINMNSLQIEDLSSHIVKVNTESKLKQHLKDLGAW